MNTTNQKRGKVTEANHIEYFSKSVVDCDVSDAVAMLEKLRIPPPDGQERWDVSAIGKVVTAKTRRKGKHKSIKGLDLEHTYIDVYRVESSQKQRWVSIAAEADTTAPIESFLKKYPLLLDPSFRGRFVGGYPAFVKGTCVLSTLLLSVRTCTGILSTIVDTMATAVYPRLEA